MVIFKPYLSKTVCICSNIFMCFRGIYGFVSSLFFHNNLEISIINVKIKVYAGMTIINMRFF